MLELSHQVSESKIQPQTRSMLRMVHVQLAETLTQMTQLQTHLQKRDSKVCLELEDGGFEALLQLRMSFSPGTVLCFILTTPSV